MSIITDVYRIAKRHVATTTAFQKFTGTTDFLAAEARVHITEIPTDKMVAASLPRARVRDVRLTGQGLGPFAGTMASGELVVDFFAAFDTGPNADSLEDQETTFRGAVGDVLEQMQIVSDSGLDEYLLIRRFNDADTISFPDLDEGDHGNVIHGSWTITWGPEGVSEGG